MLRDHDVPPGRLRFCATSATRDASNAAVFAEGVRRRLGIEPEVLSGDEEAALVYAGAIAAQVPMPPEPVLVVDIGGGSTELVLGEGGERQAVSMDIGFSRCGEPRGSRLSTGSATGMPGSSAAIRHDPLDPSGRASSDRMRLRHRPSAG